MAFFITEKETERWLEQEIRDMRMPDGSYRPAREFRITWSAKDFLDQFSDITDEDISETAVIYAEQTNKPYERAYFEVLAEYERELRKVLEIDP